jgi:hypothetical protein
VHLKPRVPISEPSCARRDGMMAELTAEQKEVLEQTVQAVERVALAMLELPKDDREEQYAIVRRNFERALQQVGIEGQAGQDWLDVTMRALRAFVAEVEAGGGGQGGRA